jgi:hypothetical protein
MASDLVEKADGFAEVFPEHKYQVVQHLSSQSQHFAGFFRNGNGITGEHLDADTEILCFTAV